MFEKLLPINEYSRLKKYVYAIVNKVENVLVNTYIFDLIDNGIYVFYVLYSRIAAQINNVAANL
jgi:hypothetical protein